MYRLTNYLTALFLGLAIGGCAPSESQRAKDQLDDSAKAQKVAVERDAAATQKAIDERTASAKDAIDQNVDPRRTEAKREATNDRRDAVNLENAAEKAKTDASEADKRAKDAK
jgi:hypothetical protein